MTIYIQLYFALALNNFEISSMNHLNNNLIMLLNMILYRKLTFEESNYQPNQYVNTVMHVVNKALYAWSAFTLAVWRPSDIIDKLQIAVNYNNTVLIKKLRTFYFRNMIIKVSLYTSNMYCNYF